MIKMFDINNGFTFLAFSSWGFLFMQWIAGLGTMLPLYLSCISSALVIIGKGLDIYDKHWPRRWERQKQRRKKRTEPED